MSFFSFRRGQPSSAKVDSQEPTADSVEVVRRRARQRLIGAAVLVLIGVIGFPLLFDSQPRPVPVDIAIEIPSRAAVKPGAPIAAPPAAVPAAPATAAPAVVPPVVPAVVPAQASLQDKEEIVAPARPAGGAAGASTEALNPTPAPVAPVAPVAPAKAKADAKPDAKAENKSEKRAEAKSDSKSDGAKGEGRIVVQVGAYADEGKVREVRQKLEKAGFKTYTQVAETGEGKRTRVRVGPFASRTEAEKAAAKIKSLNLPASLLAL
jgi:DedD protein